MNQLLGRQEITTERLLLKPLEVSDAPGMYEIYSDAETMKYWSDSPVETPAEAARMVRADLELTNRGTAAFWAVHRREQIGVIGKCTLMHYSAQNRRAEIGYVLNRKFWRQGLMSEAIRGVINFAFSSMNLHRIEADTDGDNLASLTMLEQLGFQREGYFRERWCVYDEWQDSVMLGLLESDWTGA